MPRRAAFPRRRLRRRRRLLRHLGLPDHPAAARRDRPHRRRLAAPLLRPPGAAAAAAVRGAARLGRRALAAAALAPARGRSLRRHRQLGRLHRQLALRRPVGRLLRPERRTEPGAAPLVAGDRGAVLPRLADPAARGHLALAPSRRLGPPGDLGDAGARRAGLARARHPAHRPAARRRLLLDLRPGLGALARRGAGSDRGGAHPPRRRRGARLGRPRGDRLRRLRLRRDHARSPAPPPCCRPSAPPA